MFLVVAISNRPGNASSDTLVSWEVATPTTTTKHGWQAWKTTSLERGH